MKTIARKILAMVSALAVTGIMFVSLPVPAGAFPTETVYSSTNCGFGIGNDDDVDGLFNIGFDFDYYGSTYTDCNISTNGTIGFDESDDSYYYEDLTVDSGLGDFLYPFWADLETGNGSISYATIGNAPNRKFVVQWTDVVFNENSSYNLPFGTFQAILYETSNIIQFQYRYLLQGDLGYGIEATVGIGTSGSGDNVQYSYETPSLSPEQAIRFTPDGSGGYTMNAAAAYDPIFLQASDVPGPTTMIFPTDNAFDISTTPYLEWSSVVGADWYNLYVTTNPEFPFVEDVEDESLGKDGSFTALDDPGPEVVVVEEGLTDTVYDLADAPLTAGVRYYWFVQTVGDDEGGSITGFGTFFTGPNPNPTATPATPEMPYTGR